MTRLYQERAVLFGRERSLVGVSCRPLQSQGEGPAIIFLNAGIIHRVGANRIHVRLARALAERGFSSLRFDLAGVGDSLVLPNSPAMPPQERCEIDIDDALEFAANHLDADRFIMAGLCSGADNALRTMGRNESVVGSVLLDLNGHRTRGFYLRALPHYSKNLLRWESWRNLVTGNSTLVGTLLRTARRGGSQALSESASTDTLLPDTVLPRDVMRDHLKRIVARDGRILAIFTAGLEMQYNYGGQFYDMFPDLDFGRCLQLEYFADSDHIFSRQHLQARLADVVVEWVQASDFPHPPLPSNARETAGED